MTLDDGLAEVADPLTRRPEEVLAVHQALAKLGGSHHRLEKMVELRYFAGRRISSADPPPCRSVRQPSLLDYR